MATSSNQEESLSEVCRKRLRNIRAGNKEQNKLLQDAANSFAKWESDLKKKEDHLQAGVHKLQREVQEHLNEVEAFRKEQRNAERQKEHDKQQREYDKQLRREAQRELTRLEAEEKKIAESRRRLVDERAKLFSDINLGRAVPGNEDQSPRETAPAPRVLSEKELLETPDKCRNETGKINWKKVFEIWRQDKQRKYKELKSLQGKYYQSNRQAESDGPQTPGGSGAPKSGR